MPKKLPLLLLFTFIIKISNAQIVFNFSNTTEKLQNTTFNVVGIKDARLNSTNSIGEIYTSPTRKEKVEIKNGIANGLLHYYAKYNKQGLRTGMIFEITRFEIKETLQGSLAYGELKFDLTAYSVSNDDTVKICNTRNGGRYSRTLGNVGFPNVEAQIQQSLDNGLRFVQQYVLKNNDKLESFATNSKVIVRPYKIKNSKDTVYYQQRKVNWNDFLGPINYGSNYGAAIFTSFGFDSKRYVENNTLIVEVTPFVFTNKHASWAKSSVIGSENNLKHEQTHFDICYLMSTRFIQKIKKLHYTNMDDLISAVQYEYLEFYKATTKLQDQYDTETNHSLIRDKQILWEAKITAEIKAQDLSQVIEQ